MRVDVVLPAGGRISGEFALQTDVEVKALLPLNGRTIIEHTLGVLQKTGCIERIVIIGPDEVAAHPSAKYADIVLPEDISGPANIIRGLEWLHKANGGRHAERVLILTTDLPFLTPQAVTGFLESCPPDLDICVPLVRREEFENRFPKVPAEYVRLRDGEWTMGSVFLVNPDALINNRLHIENVFAARKSQIRMARLLGLPFILRLITRRLSIDLIERRCQDMLNCTSRGLYECAPELAFDIDLPEDYRYAAAHCTGHQ